MDDDDEGPVPAWVPADKLRATIRMELGHPAEAGDRVLRAIEGGQISYRLRCEPYDGDDLPGCGLFDVWFDPTVLPYALRAADWDVVDWSIGLFRTYRIEACWDDVLAFLGEGQITGAPSQDERAQAEADCQAWLAGHMERSPDKPIGRKDLWKARADTLWPRLLGKQGFHRAWKAAIDATGAECWGRSGQRDRLPMPNLLH